MAFTADQVADVLTGRLEGTALSDVLDEGGYVSHDGGWWTRSELGSFDANRFYLPVAVADPFGNETTLAYDDEALLVTEVTDALGNTLVAQYDYRVLAPDVVTDPNENRSFAAYDGLGRVTGDCHRRQGG
jgi:YD repeat-containing protein